MSEQNGIHVGALAVTPVKGLRLLARDEVQLDRAGVPDNRRFYLIDERNRMVNGKNLGALTTVVADYDPRQRRLTLDFPDGSSTCDTVEHGATIATSFFSRAGEARLVLGPWSAALSEHAGRALRLVEAPPGSSGVDRGQEGALTLISQASLRKLAQVAGERDVDARRFRMLIEVAGLHAHAEDAWVGRAARVGGALVRVRGHVGRCLITSRHPDTGQVDLPTLDLLRSYRAGAPTTEPLALGVYGEVLEPGRVRVGDAVALA